MSVRVQLPGYYIDSVVEVGTAANDLEVINQNPSPGESNVPRSTNIVFDVARTDGNGLPSLATLKVFIQGVLAVDNGVFQPGFTGPGSVITEVGPTSQPNTLRYTIDIGSDFLSSEDITVRVFNESSLLLDTSWTFTIQDTTGPAVLAVQAREKKVIRVQYNEAMTAAGDLTAGDALTPSNYVFERISAPAVNVVATAVTQVNESTYDVETDIELTFGGEYRMTVSNVEDTSGNPILAPSNTLTFNAFVPDFPEGREFSVYRFLPQITRDEDSTQELLLWTACLQEVTNVLLCEIDEWTDILDPDIAPEIFVDAMLCDLGNPFAFVEELSLTDKRRLIRVLTDIYKSKGTAQGIKDVIRFFLGIEVEIVELAAEGWVLGEDELGATTVLGPGTAFLLYSFEVVVDFVLTDEQRQRIEDIVDFMKPAHTHLIRIVEPVVPEVIDHWELGLSELGEFSLLH